MALSGAAKTHLDNITNAANAAVTALADDDRFIRDRPMLNMQDAICEAVRTACAAEVWTDLPA